MSPNAGTHGRIARRLALATLAAAAAQQPLSDSPAAACPAGFECVEHEGRVYELSPDDGPVLAVVTETTTTVSTDLDGVTRTEHGFAAVVFSSGFGGFRVVDELDDAPAVGAFAGVAPGDVLALAGPGGGS